MGGAGEAGPVTMPTVDPTARPIGGGTTSGSAAPTIRAGRVLQTTPSGQTRYRARGGQALAPGAGGGGDGELPEARGHAGQGPEHHAVGDLEARAQGGGRVVRGGVEDVGGLAAGVADAEPDVAALRIGGGVVAAVLDVVLRGAEEVGAAGDEIRRGLGEVVEDFAAAVARGGFALCRILGDELEEVFGLQRAMTCGVEFFGQFGVGSTPGEEDFVPFAMDRGALVLQVGEVAIDGVGGIGDVQLRMFVPGEEPWQVAPQAQVSAS